MKRIWFSIVFLTIIIALCVFEQIYVKNVTENIYQQIEAIQTTSQSNDNQNQIKGKIEALQKYWGKHEKWLLVMCSHDIIYDLTTTLHQIQYRDENEIKNALAEAKALTVNIYDNQKFSLSNLF